MYIFYFPKLGIKTTSLVDAEYIASTKKVKYKVLWKNKSELKNRKLLKSMLEDRNK